MVRTVVPTEKIDCDPEDFPFLKLSKGSKEFVGRGRFCEAAIKLQSPNGKISYVQATTSKIENGYVLFLLCLLVSVTVYLCGGTFAENMTAR